MPSEYTARRVYGQATALSTGNPNHIAWFPPLAPNYCEAYARLMTKQHRPKPRPSATGGPKHRHKRASAAAGKQAQNTKNNAQQTSGGRYWLTGIHPVMQALKNPDRRIFRLVATERAAPDLARQATARGLEIEQIDRNALERLVGTDILHQGLAAETVPLDPLTVQDLPDPDPKHPILVLDQLTDPRNVGAILRSAAVFGAVAVIVQDRHAPSESAALAKAASGALDSVPFVRVGNLVRALEDLKRRGYWAAGMAGEAAQPLSAMPKDRPLALVFGAEGDGMRRLTKDACDMILSIPMAPNPVGSLNVSNAAAIVLYAATVLR